LFLKKNGCRLRKKCTETGTLLILMRYQAGFGRTGSFGALKF
jgi:acetylornithine/succinyldiaminopimelate/putrescine aminotransferase